MTRAQPFAPALALLAACSSGGGSPPIEYPPPATQTSAMAVARVGGRLKLYLPLAPSGGDPGRIAVLDGGRAGAALTNPARIGTVELAQNAADPSFASAIAGDETGLVAIGVTFPKVWFVDPATDKVTKVLTLPDSYGTSDFSGRTPFITGVIVDSGRRRAYLGVYNGFAVVDLDQKAIVDGISAPPSESFAYDPARRRLVAPFYNCPSAVAGRGGQVFPCSTLLAPDGTTVITDGLNLVDLDARALYTFHDARAASLATPLGAQPDSAAVDPASGLTIVTAEGPSEHVQVDLARVTLDPAKKAFAAPIVAVVPNAPMTGVAFTPDGGFAFAVEESTDRVGVYSRGAGALLGGRLPPAPGRTAWVSGADPHPLAVAVFGGRAWGFVASGDDAFVARIDLAAFWGLSHAAAEVTPAEMAPAVTLLDAAAAP